MKLQRNRRLQVVGVILTTFLVIALGADFMANKIPIYYRYGGEKTWPIFKSDLPEKDWRIQDYERIIFPLIPFSPNETDLGNRYLPPLSMVKIGDYNYRHWLGTDRLGRDIAAGMVHGCRKSIMVGLIAMLMAALIGVYFGAVAGYYGNHSLRISRWSSISFLLLATYLVYLTYYGIISIWWVLGIGLIMVLVAGVEITKGTGAWALPADAALLRMVEVLGAVPTLLFLIAFSALISAPSMILLAMIIAFLRWPRFALFTRSEVQKIKARDYITAAKISGLSDRAILLRFILPEALTPIVVLFAFGVASTILLESTLSFLGIGVPIEEVTWGSILGQARNNINAWWLAVYPGFAIFTIVITLNILGDQLRSRPTKI